MHAVCAWCSKHLHSLASGPAGLSAETCTVDGVSYVTGHVMWFYIIAACPTAGGWHASVCMQSQAPGGERLVRLRCCLRQEGLILHRFRSRCKSRPLLTPCLVAGEDRYSRSDVLRRTSPAHEDIATVSVGQLVSMGQPSRKDASDNVNM